jgi:hypothetical protein
MTPRRRQRKDQTANALKHNPAPVPFVTDAQLMQTDAPLGAVWVMVDPLRHSPSPPLLKGGRGEGLERRKQGTNPYPHLSSLTDATLENIP